MIVPTVSMILPTVNDIAYGVRKHFAAPLDWQYAELPTSASDLVLCTVISSNKTRRHCL